MEVGREGEGEEAVVTHSQEENFGECCVGVSGRTSLVSHIIGSVTGVRKDDGREDTIFSFMLDMCRTATKGAQVRGNCFLL